MIFRVGVSFWRRDERYFGARARACFDWRVEERCVDWRRGGAREESRQNQAEAAANHRFIRNLIRNTNLITDPN